MLGRILRRTGEADDQAWLFVLAEPTLERFSQRIADDLPDDLAVLSQVQMPATASGSTAGEIATNGHADDIGCGESGQASGMDAGSAFSLGDFAPEPTYQVSFSQHYRQQLLAFF